MAKTSIYLPLTFLFKKFVSETSSGKRLQKNGKLVAISTLKNYQALLVNLVEFSVLKEEDLQVNIAFKYSKRTFEVEKRKYNKFYKQFTDFLYKKNCTDNYVGMLIKNLKSFFIYLNQSKGYQTGDFYKNFYARREEIPIIVLSQEQLQFLINDKSFHEALLPHLKVTKDIFVIGCTIGLRFSDLITLRSRNVEVIGDKTYIVTKSKKTETATRIKIPEYVTSILKKHKGKQTTLLPSISLNQFNKNLKVIATQAGWTYEVGKERSKRGIRKELKKNGKVYKFCDMVSSHVMRRTAITTLLVLGMPETLVRKISGHAANSKEFFKYVKYSESFLDDETDKAFNKLVP
ncbi:MAG: tyrosine-type recombinase/integrase [bacterium]|nr:tyrosine-type recombinase/integrase [bacterium]